MNRFKESGFTLIELLSVVVIGSLLMALAVPSFRAFLQNNRIASQANRFVTALNTARSEAINRGMRITVCKSDDGQACDNNNNWEAGWMVFTDSSGVGVYDSSSEEKLIVEAGLVGSNTLRSSGFTDFVSYLPGGFSHDDGSFRLYDDRGSTHMRSISINATGRIQLDKGGASCP